MIRTRAQEASINAKSSGNSLSDSRNDGLDVGLATYCQGTAEGRHERVCSPSQYSPVQALPISRVEIHWRHLRTGLSVGAGSRVGMLHLFLGVRVVERRRLDRRRGVARWFFELCGGLRGRRGRVGELRR